MGRPAPGAPAGGVGDGSRTRDVLAWVLGLSFAHFYRTGRPFRVFISEKLGVSKKSLPYKIEDRGKDVCARSLAPEPIFLKGGVRYRPNLLLLACTVTPTSVLLEYWPP